LTTATTSVPRRSTISAMAFRIAAGSALSAGMAMARRPMSSIAETRSLARSGRET
jgi:hypothetical protein